MMLSFVNPVDPLVVLSLSSLLLGRCEIHQPLILVNFVGPTEAKLHRVRYFDKY